MHKKELLYPVFLECCEYIEDNTSRISAEASETENESSLTETNTTSDLFWKNIFEDLAYGKAPYGTYINKGFLCCSFKNKEFSYKLERKDPEVLYTEIYELLTTKLGILSHKEKMSKKLSFQVMEKGLKEKQRKNIKDIMYENYAVAMKNKHSLSLSQCKYLLSVIFICVMFKTITSKDVEIENEKIVNIKGIEFEKGSVVLKRSICPSSVMSQDKIEPENNDRLVDNWKKFIDELKVKYSIIS
jgi:hypothetical protein